MRCLDFARHDKWRDEMLNHVHVHRLLRGFLSAENSVGSVDVLESGALTTYHSAAEDSGS